MFVPKAISEVNMNKTEFLIYSIENSKDSLIFYSTDFIDVFKLFLIIIRNNDANNAFEASWDKRNKGLLWNEQKHILVTAVILFECP